MIPWARDSWFGFDKAEHFVWVYALWLTLRLGNMGMGASALVAVCAIVIVEVVQWWRHEMSVTGPFSDQPSFRDMAWGALGAFAGEWWLRVALG